MRNYDCRKETSNYSLQTEIEINNFVMIALIKILLKYVNVW